MHSPTWHFSDLELQDLNFVGRGTFHPQCWERHWPSHLLEAKSDGDKPATDADSQAYHHHSARLQLKSFYMRTEPYWHCIVPHLEKPLSDFISQTKLVGSFWPLKTKPHCREDYSEGRLGRSCRDGGTLLVVYSKDTWGQAPCCRMSSAPWDYKPVFLPGKAHSSTVSKRTLICFPLMLINDSAFHVE